MTGETQQNGERSIVTSGCHPAILIVPKGSNNLKPPDRVPDASDVTEVVTDALEAAGWSEPTDTLLDVREDVIPYQDEVPPREPVDLNGVVVTLGQCPVTQPLGWAGPFRVALDALGDEYGDMYELAVDAVSMGGGS